MMIMFTELEKTGYEAVVAWESGRTEEIHKNFKIAKPFQIHVASVAILAALLGN
jgi:hypothetical protein